MKNISEIGNLPQIGVKIKNIWNHHLDHHFYNSWNWFSFTQKKGDQKLQRLGNLGLELLKLLHSWDLSTPDIGIPTEKNIGILIVGTKKPLLLGWWAYPLPTGNQWDLIDPWHIWNCRVLWSPIWATTHHDSCFQRLNYMATLSFQFQTVKLLVGPTGASQCAVLALPILGEMYVLRLPLSTHEVGIHWDCT